MKTDETRLIEWMNTVLVSKGFALESFSVVRENGAYRLTVQGLISLDHLEDVEQAVTQAPVTPKETAKVVIKKTAVPAPELDVFELSDVQASSPDVQSVIVAETAKKTAKTKEKNNVASTPSQDGVAVEVEVSPLTGRIDEDAIAALFA